MLQFWPGLGTRAPGTERETHIVYLLQMVRWNGPCQVCAFHQRIIQAGDPSGATGTTTTTSSCHRKWIHCTRLRVCVWCWADDDGCWWTRRPQQRNRSQINAINNRRATKKIHSVWVVGRWVILDCWVSGVDYKTVHGAGEARRQTTPNMYKRKGFGRASLKSVWVSSLMNLRRTTQRPKYWNRVKQGNLLFLSGSTTTTNS